MSPCHSSLHRRLRRRVLTPLILSRCNELQDQLIELVWKKRPQNLITAPSTIGGTTSYTGYSDAASVAPFNLNEKGDPTGTGQKPEGANEKRSNAKSTWFGWKTEKNNKDIEADRSAVRPTRLFAPVYNGIGAGLCLCK